MYYEFTRNDGTILFSNLASKCNFCSSQPGLTNKTQKCQLDGKRKRYSYLENSIGRIFFCSMDIESTKMFKTKQKMLSMIMSELDDHRNYIEKSISKDMVRLLHNLVTHNAHCIQAFYYLVPPDELMNGDKTKLEVILDHVEAEPSETATLLLKLFKHNSLMKTEFSVFHKLYERNPRLEILPHSIHKIIHMIFNIFWQDFIDKDVAVNIEKCQCVLNFDFESVVAALVHLFDNTTKYIMAHSELRIKFVEDTTKFSLIMEMQSLKVFEDEKNKIFEEGYSGRYPNKINLAGNGIGLSIAKKLLKLNNANLLFYTKAKKTSNKTINDVEYDYNIFEIEFPPK